MCVGRAGDRSTVHASSGILAVNPDLIAEMARTIPVGLITTKSIGLEPYDGYPEPIVSRWPDGSLSTAVGLSTMGCDEWAREMASIYPIPDRLLFCLERHTACGIGLCGKCSVDGKRTCVDGPWFSGADLVDSIDFGMYHRRPSGLKVPLSESCATAVR